MAGLYKFTQHFDNAPAKSFDAPFDSLVDAQAFGEAVLGSAFEVFEPLSQSGDKNVTAYQSVLILLKKVVNGVVTDKGYINAIVKPTVSENDIQSALVGKTYADGVSTWTIDEVGVIEKKAVA